MAKRKSDTPSLMEKSKRCKYIGGPRVKTGILSAGASAAEKEDAAPIKIKDDDISDVTVSQFFDENGATAADSIMDAAKKIKIDKKGMIKALRKNGTEEALRDAVFKAFCEFEGLNFPQNSKRFLGKYREQTIVNLFQDVMSLVIGETWEGALSEYEQDLLVKNTSRPDMAVLKETGENNGGKSLMELKLGEFKNGEKYDEAFSVSQDCLYLIILLYVFRVKLGIKVDAVFGFSVCGYKCNDLDSVRRTKITRKVKEEGQYRISLIKLSAPTRLGENFRVEKYSKIFSTDDVTGIQLLAYYLRHGKVAINNAELIRGKLSVDQRSPSLFLVPSEKWDDEYIKKSGTGSVVFGPYPSDRVLDELSHIHTQLPSIWDAHKKKVNRYISQEGDGKQFYIKLHLRHAYVRFEKTTPFPHYDTLKEDSDTDEDQVFFETYPIRPYCDDDVRVIISVDRGSRILLVPGTVEKQSTLQKFCQELLLLCERTVQENFVLGDAFPHNIVEDSQSRLFFIDYDQGVSLGQQITRRIVDYTLNDENCWFKSLEYPNDLVRKGHDYTKVQLGVCVLQLMSFYVSDMSSQGREEFDKLQEMGTIFGNHLFSLSGKKEIGDKEMRDLMRKAREFYETAMGLLKVVSA